MKMQVMWFIRSKNKRRGSRSAFLYAHSARGTRKQCLADEETNWAGHRESPTYNEKNAKTFRRFLRSGELKAIKVAVKFSEDL